MGTQNCSLLSSATRCHSGSPSNCCFPASPNWALIPIDHLVPGA